MIRADRETATGSVGLCNLNGSSSSSEQAPSAGGLLEVYTEFGWSAVHSSGFGGVEAQVVCAQLGYSFVANVATVVTASRYSVQHI